MLLGCFAQKKDGPEGDRQGIFSRIVSGVHDVFGNLRFGSNKKLQENDWQQQIRQLNKEASQLEEALQGDGVDAANVYMRMGGVYLGIEKFKSAEICFRTALEIADKKASKRSIAQLKLFLGIALRGQHQHTAANVMLRDSVVAFATYRPDDKMLGDALDKLAIGYGFDSGSMIAKTPEGVLVRLNPSEGNARMDDLDVVLISHQ